MRFRPAGALLLLLAPSLLAAQASPAPEGSSGTYRLLADSRLEVKTGKSGLLGFVGHDHIIRAGAFDGEVHYRADSVTATTLRIRILTEGLEVLTPPDTAEIRKVTAAMRSEVLHTAEYPEMFLVSRAIARAGQAWRVTAELTMHGVTREITVPVTVEFRGDTLVAKSRFDLKQTDFGIRPYKGGPAGAVKVADKVEFRIEARALRE
jgi:polyisoprenoid-binding protein YceI